ncbi:MAG: hypothetical protein DI547_14155 [Sphingobium sp.]|jgi:hypothetical protein|nr:MAG: hypothetical protein DI547_14155 [Sphingobium sp.]
MRRLRDALIPGALFADPAWDLLLDLFAAGLEEKTVCTTSASIAAAVPSTTALRWIGRLIDGGWVRRFDDPDDGRRSLLELTPKAQIAVERWVREAL